MVWDLEKPTTSTKGTQLAKGMNYLLGNHFPGLETNTQRFFSLYAFLLKNIDMPVEQLRLQILDKGKPIFSTNDLNEILPMLKQQKNTQIAKYVVSRKAGGGDSAVLPNAKPAAPGAPAAPAAPGAPPQQLDATRTKFWDKFMHKISFPVTSRIPPSWDGVMWYFFILYNLEQMDFVGPMISTALDTVTLSLPVIADLSNEMASKVVSLAPVPYASFVGDGIGYLISLIFISFAVVLNSSRKHFGSSFKVSLEAVPVFGDILAESAQSVEIGADRYLTNREKMLKSVEKVSPSAEAVLDYYTPDVEIHNEAPPPVSMNLIKHNVVDYVAEETGISAAANTLSDPTKLIKISTDDAIASITNQAKPNNAKPNNVKANNAKPNNAKSNAKPITAKNTKNATLKGGRRYTRRRR
jgi:hypothetical protein